MGAKEEGEKSPRYFDEVVSSMLPVVIYLADTLLSQTND